MDWPWDAISDIDESRFGWEAKQTIVVNDPIEALEFRNELPQTGSSSKPSAGARSR